MRPRLQPGRRRRYALSPALPLLLATSLLLSACGSVPRATPPVADAGSAKSDAARNGRPLPALPPAGSGRGGYYLDDGPGDRPPDGLYDTPDADPKVEPLPQRINKPYVVFGKTYTPVTSLQQFTQRGHGSWYGKKFHGQKTSSGELYDMYKMTAAHPTLPIPSYARVTNLANGRQVIVRVNDRGPFHSSRIVDLSYTAALKLGYIGKGSAELQVDLLLPDEIARINSGKVLAVSQAPAQAVASPAPMPLPVQATTATKMQQVQPSQPLQPSQLSQLSQLSQPSQPVQQLQPVGQVQPVQLAREARPSVLTSAKGSPALRDDATTQPHPIANLLGALGPSAPAADASSAPGTVAVLPGGYYLQLGAYSRDAGAEEFRARLARDWPANLPPVEVVRTGSIYRIHSGPYTSRADAESAARSVQSAGPARPVIVQR
ncbi:MAG: Endolytic peptidoglycan transglycosylase RlpA [Herminiimonas sp.]|nr:Endolytic peptidoglycan transglycosylase RlpA [Herminiimonas sp.]